MSTVHAATPLSPGVARDIADRFAVVDERRLRVDGRIHETGQTRLGPALARHVYTGFHLGLDAGADAGAPPDDPQDRARRARLQDTLGAAITVDPGWERSGSDGEAILVRKDGLTLTACPDELTRAGDGTTGVRMPSLRPRALPGWSVYVSRQGQPDSRDLWRLYVDVHPDRGEAALADAVRRLESHGLEFQAKLAAPSVAAGRPDRLVAFVGASAFPPAVEWARATARRGWCGTASPGFARTLAPGVAVAPEPQDGSGQSFGQRCATLAARALTTVPEVGSHDVAARAAAVQAVLAPLVDVLPPMEADAR